MTLRAFVQFYPSRIVPFPGIGLAGESSRFGPVIKNKCYHGHTDTESCSDLSSSLIRPPRAGYLPEKENAGVPK
jgi:hypothetical protein